MPSVNVLSLLSCLVLDKLHIEDAARDYAKIISKSITIDFASLYCGTASMDRKLKAKSETLEQTAESYTTMNFGRGYSSN